jgi:formamidopyrimidine-DNA glycosylase
MPELPEIETIVRGLRPHLAGRRILRARLSPRALYRRGSLSVNRLVNRRVIGVERVGKNALFRFPRGAVMVINLGMTGRLLVCGVGDDPPEVDRRHLHGRFVLAGSRELRFYDARRFGHVYVAESCDFEKDLNIGPDALGIDEPDLRVKLRNRKASIKALLLDQRIISGIGNIYADETLFYSRIHPRTPGGAVAGHTGRLLESARRVLQDAIEQGGSTVRDYRKLDGSPGGFQRFHAVYGKGGAPCIRCGNSILRIVIGGRGTHFCPYCQE